MWLNSTGRRPDRLISGPWIQLSSRFTVAQNVSGAALHCRNSRPSSHRTGADRPSSARESECCSLLASYCRCAAPANSEGD